ncbi:MAG: hypothetical protein ABIR55_16540 [Burkholderiaceae bacterium]
MKMNADIDRAGEDDKGVSKQSMRGSHEFLVDVQLEGADQLRRADPLLECGANCAQQHCESVLGTAITHHRMNNALREWLDRPDVVPDGTVFYGLIEHTMCGLEPASVTKKSARARLLRL